VGTQLIAALPLSFKSTENKAFRIGSNNAPATPSEIEQIELKYESKHVFVRICNHIVQWLDNWVLEPILTIRRLAHILILFVPVVITVPVVFFGEKSIKESQTQGTLWWFDFLAKQMERAGPTFIKVKLSRFFFMIL
jgi:aarF domain-containing kinase